MPSILNPYVILAALAAFFVTGAGAYLKGRSDCSARYEYAAIKEQRDNLLQLWEISEAARHADAQRLMENQALLRDLQEKAEHDAQNLQDGGAVCFAPADTDSLRQHFRLSN